MPPKGTKKCTKTKIKNRSKEVAAIDGQSAAVVAQGAGPSGQRAAAAQSVRPTRACRGHNAPAPATVPEDADPGSSVQESTDSELSEGANKAKRKKKDKVVGSLTAVEEESMVEWLREHPEMYNKKLQDYKNIQKKEALWQEKAQEMGKQVQVLQVWYKSLRTRMGKLMKKKSGQGDEELTDRDKWILSNLVFLKVHILAVHRRPLVSVSNFFS